MSHFAPESESIGLIIRRDDAGMTHSVLPDEYFFPSGDALLVNHFDWAPVEIDPRALINRLTALPRCHEDAGVHRLTYREVFARTG